MKPNEAFDLLVSFYKLHFFNCAYLFSFERDKYELDCIYDFLINDYNHLNINFQVVVHESS